MKISKEKENNISYTVIHYTEIPTKDEQKLLKLLLKKNIVKSGGGKMKKQFINVINILKMENIFIPKQKWFLKNTRKIN